MTPHLKLSIFRLLVLSSNCIGAIAAPHSSPHKYNSIGPSIASRNITTRADNIDAAHYFKQRVDHQSRLSGKFKQRYWVNTQHYQPSGPIFLVIGGSDPAAKTDTVSVIKRGGLIEMFAEGFAGACVVLEHRYFGESLPYKDLSEKSLKRLTIEQSIEDLAYFAQKVKLPSPIGYAHPDNTPWVIVGSGYAGTLANWAMLKYPDIFSVGYASSAPAKAQEEVWEYWDSARRTMISQAMGDCSAALERVANHIDAVAASNNKKEEARLKKLLQLDGVTEMVDVAEAVAYSLKIWDSRQLGKLGTFNTFCNTIEKHRHGKIDELLAAWGKWNEEMFEGNNDDAFWGTHDENHARFTDINIGRPWIWLQCNELGWFRTAAPKTTHSLLPRLLNIDNEWRICSMHFPKTFPNNNNPNPMRFEETNSKFKTVQASRLLVTVGEFDAWANSGVSFRSLDKNLRGSILEISEGFIASDMYKLFKNGQIYNEQRFAYGIIQDWLEKYQPTKSSSAFKSWLKKIKAKGSQLKAGRG